MTTSVDEIAAALRSGGLTASAIAEWAIANHAARGEVFDAYKALDADRFRSEAQLADNVSTPPMSRPTCALAR